MFGPEFRIKSPAELAVQTFITTCERKVLVNALGIIAREVSIVAKRQLADFLKGGSFTAEKISPEEIESLSHCPLTNLIGEGAFGDFDYDYNKRRHCSNFNRSNLQVSKRNNVVSFLQSTPEAKKEKLFSYGRAHAPEMRKKKRDEEAMVKLQVQEKMAANQDEHLQKSMKAVCSNADLLATLKITGGP